MDVERDSGPALKPVAEGRDEEGPGLKAWLLELGDLVEHMVGLLKRQRTAMSRHDLRLLSQLLSQQEQVLRRLNEMSCSPEGVRALTTLRAGGSGNPELARLYRQLLTGLIELVAINHANQHFLIGAQQAIHGALYWHSGLEGRERLTSYTRRGRLAV